jgi:hypothetical protein
LKKHFPRQKNDKNELPDDISVGWVGFWFLVFSFKKIKFS